MKTYVLDALSTNKNTKPHTYDGVDDVVDVLSRVIMRDFSDFEKTVEWILRDWICDRGYLVVPREDMATAPLPEWY